MSVVEAHFFAPHDLNGDTIFECSSDDQFLKGIRLEIQRDKLGNGLIEFARRVGTALFDRGIVQPEVFVRFLVPEISATDYLWGCFLDYRQQKLVSAKELGGEGFRFGGPGPKYYLTRTVLFPESFTGLDHAVHADEHVWTWPETAKAGRILNKLLLEDAANPDGPFLPDLTKSFDDLDDSNGVPWSEDVASAADEFSINIGDDYLKLLWTLENAGSLVTQMTLGSVGAPLMQLDAYQTFGRDLTGAIGASTVHFTEGVNILTDLDVEGSSLRKASHALVQGADGVYELAVRPSWDPGEYRKVALHVYENSTSPFWLDKAGIRFLQRQENGEKQIKLRWQPGFDPANGLYMPGPDGSNGHVWVGDTVDLTTGGASWSELDYQSEAQLVTGIQMELLRAVREDSAEEAARSWKLTALLNYDRESNATTPAGGTTGGGTDTHIHRPPYRLCRAGTPGTSPVIVAAGGNIGDLGGTANVTLNIPSDEDGAALYAVVIDTGGGTIGVQWQHHATDPGSRETMTLIDSDTVGGIRIGIYRLLNPTPTSSGASFVRFTDSAAQERFVGYWYVTGVDQSDPDDAPVFANGVGSQSAVEIPGGISSLMLNAAGWWENNQSSVATPTAGGGQTLDYAGSVDRPFGQPDGEGGIGHGSSAPSWSWGTVQSWLAVGIALNASDPGIGGELPEPLGAAGEASAGECTCLARGCHVHEHGNLADHPDETMHHARQTELTPVGAITATNVQDGFAQVSEARGVSWRQLASFHRFPLIAHRGDINPVDGYPEDTLEAGRLAAQRGAEFVETDTIRSADGTWYSIHDATVDRTTDGTGNVADKTDAQMDALNIDGGYGYNAGRHGTSLNVPTLEAWITAVLLPYHTGAFIGLQESGDAAHTALAEFIVSLGVEDRVIIGCNDSSGGAAVKAVSSRIGTTISLEHTPSPDSDVFDAAGGREADISTASAVNALAPISVWRVMRVEDGGYSTDEQSALADAFDIGCWAFMTNHLPNAIDYRHEYIYGTTGMDEDAHNDLDHSDVVQAAGRWEPVVTDTGGSEPAFVFHDGDIVVTFVET